MQSIIAGKFFRVWLDLIMYLQSFFVKSGLSAVWFQPNNMVGAKYMFSLVHYYYYFDQAF